MFSISTHKSAGPGAVGIPAAFNANKREERKMVNDFCHMELNTNDLEGARSFYLGMFDWETEDWPMPNGGNYVMIKTGEGPGGGMMKSPVEHPPMWAIYINVDEIEASCKKAEELGGKVIMGKTAVGEMGFFAVLQDPQGAVFAIWEMAKKE